MGEIFKKDINLRTPTKLALVGFLSFYIGFKVKCVWLRNAGALGSGLSCSRWAKLQLVCGAEGCVHSPCNMLQQQIAPLPKCLRGNSQPSVVLAKQRSGTVQRRGDISYTCGNGTATY